MPQSPATLTTATDAGGANIWLGLRTMYYETLVRYAALRFAGIPDAEAIVADVITDVALHLATNATVPEHPAFYLFGSLKNRLGNALRNRSARDRLHGRGEPVDSWTPRGISEWTLRASLAPDEEPAHSGRLALAAVLEAQLTRDERTILAWVGAGITQEQIAAWLGRSPGAVRVQLCRLRRRFAHLAPEALS